MGCRAPAAKRAPSSDSAGKLAQQLARFPTWPQTNRLQQVCVRRLVGQRGSESEGAHLHTVDVLRMRLN